MIANITSNGDIEILSNMPILTSNKRLYIRIWLEDNLLQNNLPIKNEMFIQ